MNFNKAIIAGRVTKDPVRKTFQSGNGMATFGIATNKVFTDNSGQKQEKTEFHNVVFWGKITDVIMKFVKKGGLILVEGSLETRKWQDKEGKDRYTTNILGERLQLGPKPKNAVEEPQVDESDVDSKGDIKEEDLPF